MTTEGRMFGATWARTVKLNAAAVVAILALVAVPLTANAEADRCAACGAEGKADDPEGRYDTIRWPKGRTWR